MTLELCQLREYEIRNIFMEKSCRKYMPKASPRTLFILVNNPKIGHCMQEILSKIRYFETGLSKSFIFSFEPSPLMDNIIKNKRGLDVVTSHS